MVLQQDKLIKAMSNSKRRKKRFDGKEYHYHSLPLNMQVCFVMTQGHTNTKSKDLLYCTQCMKRVVNNQYEYNRLFY